MPTSAAAREPETSEADREARIRAAVAVANSNALRMALYQVMGDPELAEMKLDQQPIRGGALQLKVVAQEDLLRLQEKAVAFLMGGDAETPPPPDAEQTRNLLKTFTDQPVTENYLRFGAEELAFDKYPRDVHWSSPPSADTLADLKVAVIGGGISGVAAAIQLKRLGINHRVIERQSAVGGTWQLNSYPEARVDTSSYTYQFKFEKNYRWTEYFAARDETRKYLNFIVDKYGVRDSFQFDTEVIAAHWDEARALWMITARRRDGGEETIEANFIISGSGLFATPNMPDIPGIETFRGEMFHTTRWDHDYDYAAKRVALIGTGSTGTQLMPALARAASQLTVYQRTANWITGVDGYRSAVPEETQYLFDHLPYYWNWFCYSGFDTALQLQNAQTYDHEWRKNNPGISEANEKLKAVLTGYIHGKLGSRPDLVAKCTPNHAPLGRRLVVDNGFYESLLRPNVELATDGIARITPTGILSNNGVERAFDLIVLGAGFKVAKYLYPVDYVGRDGATLEKAWAMDGARSYLGLAMPGFPNLFMLYGPQGQPRSGGFYSWAEVWARYAVGMIVRTVESGGRSAEVRRDVFEDYNQRLDTAMKEVLWEEEGAGSYFNNEFGRSQVNIPFRTEDYHAMVAEPALEDYEIRP